MEYDSREAILPFAGNAEIREIYFNIYLPVIFPLEIPLKINAVDIDSFQ